MHGPVAAAHFAELIGAIERVDDPHPVGAEAARVVGALFRQHGIVGPRLAQRLHQETVTGYITRIHHLPRRRTPRLQFGAHLHQQVARLGGES